MLTDIQDSSKFCQPIFEGSLCYSVSAKLSQLFSKILHICGCNELKVAAHICGCI